MGFVSFVALLALFEYLVFALLTGRARQTYNIEAPATTGHPVFERWYRVQQNTVEQLVVFLPALFLFAYNGHTRLAGWLGLLFVVGRVVYARSYVADPKSRSVGFGLGFIAVVLLLVGALLTL
jgi:uncharacterized MAPEG superfamily protein